MPIGMRPLVGASGRIGSSWSTWSPMPTSRPPAWRPAETPVKAPGTAGLIGGMIHRPGHLGNQQAPLIHEAVQRRLPLASVYKRTRDRQRKGACWYIAYTDHNQKRQTVKGCPDKAST